MIVSNLSFVYGQDCNFHIPKYEKMDGDILVHHTGYSALYNTNYKVSRWIGYKLKKEHLGVENLKTKKNHTLQILILVNRRILKFQILEEKDYLIYLMMMLVI
jgi:hypothetical protein